MDDLPGAGIEDPVVNLVFGAASLDRLFVNGKTVVAAGHLTTADEPTLAANAAKAAGRRPPLNRPDRGSFDHRVAVAVWDLEWSVRAGVVRGGWLGGWAEWPVR